MAYRENAGVDILPVPGTSELLVQTRYRKQTVPGYAWQPRNAYVKHLDIALVLQCQTYQGVLGNPRYQHHHLPGYLLKTLVSQHLNTRVCLENLGIKIPKYQTLVALGNLGISV